jgi:glycosyltransferase involved in cell wall biosynthesis
MDPVCVAHLRDSGGIFGAERVILTIGKNIDKRFRMILICMREADGKSDPLMKRAKEVGIPVIPVDIRGKMDIASIFRIRKILRNNQVRILHSHGFKSNLYGLLASMNLGIKRILTDGGTTRDSIRKRFYVRMDETITYQHYDRIIAVSPEIRDRLAKRNIGAGKVVLIENGIDPSLYETDSAEGDGPVSLPTDRGEPIFAVIGRLFPDKGHRYFLQSFSGIVEKKPASVALIIGDGPSEEEIRRQVMELNLGNNVILCGRRQDMKNIYDRIDYLVIPSLTEGLPYVLLEAMSCKVPVLATDVGGIPGLVINGVTGYLVPPGDAVSLQKGMEEMADNPKRSEAMAENAYNLVREKYSAKRMVDRIGSLYDAMMHDSPGQNA